MSPLEPKLIADRFEVLGRLTDRGRGESWHCRDAQRAGGSVIIKFLRRMGPALPPSSVPTVDTKTHLPRKYTSLQKKLYAQQ
jgi:hypothetical protein